MPLMLKIIYSDLARVSHDKKKFRQIISAFLFDPGFKSVVLYRIQQRLTVKWPRVTLLVSSLNLKATGAQYCVGASIDSGLLVRHPNGIVIGGGVKIGKELTIAQGVTIGQDSLHSREVNLYPVIGERVTLGAHSIVIGNIELGDDVTIGAMTLIKSSIQEGLTVVGNPNRVIKRLENN